MEFTVHQALFGYDGGHQLLAASLRLPTEARQFLAVATDLSGSAPPRGFEQTYTGLPLPGTNFYALFCTWLAREMPRPGCVWSQALLIDLSDFAALSDLGTLRKLFVRPVMSEGLSFFSHPQCYVVTPECPHGLNTNDLPRAVDLLVALYKGAKRPVLVSAIDAAKYEDLIFALWSQQWPRMKRNFRFSTGSFADRGRGGFAFDVQITPEVNLGAWRRDGVVLLKGRDIEDGKNVAKGVESWIDIAVDDLMYPDRHGLRTFFHTYGADVGTTRAAFMPLTGIYVRFNSIAEQRWSSMLQSIAVDFPSPDEARTLKVASISKRPSLSREAAHDRLVDIINFLCLEDTKGAFAQVDFDFTEALVDLWPARREILVAILIKPPLTEVRWTALACAVAKRLSADELSWLCETHSELLAPFVRTNPSLATTINIWRLSDRCQWIVVEALEACNVSETLWRQVIRAMVASGTTVAAREVSERAGSSALDGALDWLVETTSAELPPPLWREALRPLAEKRLEESTLSPLSCAFCAALVPPAVAANLAPTRLDVQTLAAEPLENLPVSLRLSTAFLLVTLGLKSTEQIGTPLLASGFFHAHDALKDATEPPEAWRMLQPLLPPVRFWQEWDRCLKLRGALENWIETYPNALDAISTAAKTSVDKKWLESLR